AQEVQVRAKTREELRVRREDDRSVAVKELKCHANFDNEIARFFDKANGNASIFASVHQYFVKLHLKELRLNNVPLEHELLKPFNDFIDDRCAFDRLTITMEANGILSNRTRGLMTRAKRDVVIDVVYCANTPETMQLATWNPVNLTPELLESIQRPVKFNGIEWSRWGCQVPAVDDEELFKEIVTKGHSMTKLNTLMLSKETLAEVIEKISSSEHHQKIDIRVEYFIDFREIERYLEEVGAVPMLDQPPSDESFASLNARGLKVQSFSHRGATFHLATVFGIPKC
ncbi:hypothetical protein PENTCL1PPCAC_3479, partial [Pristionchus entomophagus]